MIYIILVPILCVVIVTLYFLQRKQHKKNYTNFAQLDVRVWIGAPENDDKRTASLLFDLKHLNSQMKELVIVEIYVRHEQITKKTFQKLVFQRINANNSTQRSITLSLDTSLVDKNRDTLQVPLDVVGYFRDNENSIHRFKADLKATTMDDQP